MFLVGTADRCKVHPSINFINNISSIFFILVQYNEMRTIEKMLASRVFSINNLMPVVY